MTRITLARRRWAAMALVAAGVSALPAEAQLRLVPVDIRVPALPIPVVSRDSTRLVYELRLSNWGRRDLMVQSVEVRGDDAAVLARWEGDDLKKAMIPAGGPPPGDSRNIGAGRQGVFFAYVIAPASATPRALSHRIVVAPTDSVAQPPDTIAGYRVPVRRRSLPVLRSPFGNGGVWVAVNGPGNTSGHRRTGIPLEGQVRIAQRFATDWIELGPDGTPFHGDSTKNENWYGHGHPIVAVAAGTVVAVKDGIPENVPLSPTRAVPITLETVGGNHVIIDLGDGFYGFYAHLVPGSVAVKVGDRVKPGQQVGLLGNSGNSTAPHLHFHVGDAPSPLGTEGLPFVFAGYRLLGNASILETGGSVPRGWLAPTAGDERRRETPLENDVIRFPR